MIINLVGTWNSHQKYMNRNLSNPTHTINKHRGASFFRSMRGLLQVASGRRGGFCSSSTFYHFIIHFTREKVFSKSFSKFHKFPPSQIKSKKKRIRLIKYDNKKSSQAQATLITISLFSQWRNFSNINESSNLSRRNRDLLTNLYE